MTIENDLECPAPPIEELFLGEPGTWKVAELLAHLEVCPLCRQRLQVMLGLQILLQPVIPERSGGIADAFQLKAASILLLASLGSALLLWTRLPGDDPVRWWERAPQPPFQLQTRADPGRAAPDEAFEAYRRGRYAEAEAALAGYPEDPTARLFRGISLFLLGRFEEAQLLFSALAADSGEFRSESLWFQARIYLQRGQPEAASKALERIEPGSRYREPARQLLRQIEEGRQR